MSPRDLQMMSGDGFMQRKRQHFPLWPGLWFIKIYKVGSRARAVRSALPIVSSRGIRRSHRRNRLYSVGLSRQCAEDFDQVRVDCFRQCLIGVKQLVGRLVKELRISAQIVEELL